ncbi:MAG TPA: PP2C family protein-serine/threonine phosphatase [Thermoanaerobaculia bacterium]|nr:PP2C family protein-serine/threonine phosphatase [Thermoanaerobaculia bacterium]
MTESAAHPRPRIPWVPLVAGLVVLVAGAVAAHRILPEWQPLGVSKEFALRTAREEMTAAGATLLAPKAKVRNGAANSELERAYRRLGREAPGWLARHGAIASWVVSGDLRVPGIGTGTVEISIARDGTLRRVEFTSGSVFRVAAPTGELAGARERLSSTLLARLARGAAIGRSADYESGNAMIRVYELEGNGPGPREVLTRLAPTPAMLIVAREISDPDVGARFERLKFRGLAIAIPLFGLVGLLVVVLFGVLLFRRRLGFRIAVGLGLLGLVAMVVSGSLFELQGQNGAVAGFIVTGRLLMAVALAGYWVVAESMLRDTVPGFRTSLDALAAGRLSPRLGKAILGGLGLGAAIAGARLIFAAGVAAAGVRGVHPETPSYVLPLFGGIANAFLEGPYAAATLILVAALFRHVLPRERADVLGAVAYALFYACSFQYAPWGATLVLYLAEAALLLLAFRTLGLTGLLIAATAPALLRDLFASLRFPGELAAPMLLAAGALAALAWVGVAACRRPEREDEARLDTPGFIKRIESETRVKYEMDLLSRMQLALLPDHPPDVPGLQIAAKTILATEAGGDLYEFLVDEEGALWVAAGDVAGHGYSCGIQGAMVKACLLTLVKAGRRPAEILAEVDRVLRAANTGRLFTSLVLLRIEPETGRGVLANAGHPYPLLVVEGRVRELTGSGLPLGKGPARIYEETEFELPGSASLVLASDGLFEGPDRFDDPYGYDKPRLVLERVGLWRRPAGSILEALIGDWRTHVGEGEPADDTSVVVVRRTIWS